MPEPLFDIDQLLQMAELTAQEKLRPLSEAEQMMLDRWRTQTAWTFDQSEFSDIFQAFLSAEKQTEPALLEFHQRHLAAQEPHIPQVHFLRAAWFRVAAAVILFLGVGGYFLLSNNERKPVLTQTTNTGTQKDILPGSNRATLVLGDESIIELDTAANGLLTKQGGSEVIKTDNGEILYTGARDNDHVFYQKLITPRGGQYQITLSDGTQVWLNAASSIRFPNVFIENTRTVEITGEVYFEVKANKSKPFIVKTITDEIAVIGTRFNIHSYANEPVKTTLIDGAVKIHQTVLQPGQAYLNGKIIPTNIDQDVAWKNGRFYFDKTKLPDAMRQLARWYDVTIQLNGDFSSIELGGEIDRNLSLQDVISGLQDADLYFQLEGRTLIISNN